MDKKEKLLALAKLRQSKTYSGYTAIGDYNEGAYECDYVSPYSISSHNENSDVLVVLQDWCSEEGFGEKICEETLRYGYTPSVKTNVYLKALLLEYFSLTLEEIYSTNLFPYIKPGSMSDDIAANDLLNSAKEFTIPMIEIIRPKIVVCLGKDTFNALRKACGLKVVYSIEEGVSSHFSHNGSEVFCQSHTGQLGKNNRNRGGVDRVSTDWEIMSSYLKNM